MSSLSDRVSPLKKETLQDGVYRGLCELILQGGLAPGQSVTVASLADAFGVSPMPVREALTRLFAAGALTVISGRTVGVPKLTRERLDDLRRVRREVEPLAAQWAAGRVDVEFIDALQATLSHAEHAASRGDGKLYVQANYDFHFTIYRHAASPLLLSIIENLWLQISPYFHLLRASGHFSISNQHHEEILAALQARDGPRSASALIGDIEDAYEVLIDVI